MNAMRAVLFHVSPTVNRESILRCGLDVSLMGATLGIAGSVEPEAAGTHLVDHVDEALWYASFGRHGAVDIWEVDSSGLRLQEHNGEWLCLDVIPPERLSLFESDVVAEEASKRLNIPPADEGGLIGGLTIVEKRRSREPDQSNP